MTLRQLLLVLRARWKTILVVFTLIVGSTLAVVLLLPKQYTAASLVIVEVRSPDPIYGVGAGAALPAIATEVDIINSDRVAYRVVKMLGLDRDPAAREQWLDDGGGKGTLESYYAALLQKKLDVQPPRESNVISIGYTSSDPKLAARTANTFARAYIDTSVELKADPAKTYSSWFAVHTKQLREDLEKAQAKLSSFQGSQGIVGTDERADVENARLAELSTQLSAVQGQLAESSSRHQQAVGNAASSPDIMQNPVIVGLRTDISRSEAKVKELSVSVGPNHPQYRSAQQELSEFKSKLGGEMAQVASSVGTTNRVNVQREAEARAALAAQKRRVLVIQEQRDQLRLLQKDVEGAQRNYDMVNQRLAQTSLESQTQQTNVGVLAPAAEPVKPSKPKVLLSMLIAVFVSIWVGAATALVAEVADRRVRSMEDITEILDLPVLAVLKTTTLVDRRPKLLGVRRSGPPITLQQQ